MDPVTLNLAIGVGVQLAQAALDWQQKIAAGAITDADIDEALSKVGMSRAALQAAIDAAKAEGR